MRESIVFNFRSDIAVKMVQTVLIQQGLHVVRSFDLRSALASHADCPCPHHGTARCNCQYIVMLVYGYTENPVVLTIHSYGDQTQVQIVQDAITIPEPLLSATITAALREGALTPEATLVG
jgi:hypothetical protein